MWMLDGSILFTGRVSKQYLARGWVDTAVHFCMQHESFVVVDTDLPQVRAESCRQIRQLIRPLPPSRWMHSRCWQQSTGRKISRHRTIPPEHYIRIRSTMAPRHLSSSKLERRSLQSCSSSLAERAQGYATRYQQTVLSIHVVVVSLRTYTNT